jgi:DNA repair photolyase
MRRTADAIGGMPDLPGMRLGEMRVTEGGRAERRKGGKLGQLPLPLEGPPRALPVLDERERGTRFLALPVRRVLNPPATTHMPFWSINPYVGCEFGCSYCYARKTHEWTMERTEGRKDGRTEGESPTTDHDLPSFRLSAFASFEHDILVKSGAPEVLLRTLDPSLIGGRTVVIGTATDPYQPAERRFLLTRRLLEALLRHRGLSLGLITKSPLVTRDLDLFTRLAERHKLSINISLASTDALLLRRLEVRSPAPHARLRALERLTRAGIIAGLMVAPILPGITDGWPSLAALMEAAREAGAHFVHGAPLRLGPAARAGFLPVLKREFPDLVARYERRYGAANHAGKDYERALQRRLRSLRAAFGFAERDMP